jgi:hypothetical protein
MYEARALRARINQGDFACVPQAFMQAPGGASGKTITSRLEKALGVADALGGCWGSRSHRAGSIADRVLSSAGDEAGILDAVGDFEATHNIHRTAGDLISLYGLAGPEWNGIRGAQKPARLAAFLAADVVLMPYAHGVLLAQKASPADMNADVRSLSLALYVWANQDYPAVALALGAALRGPSGDVALRCPFLEQLVARVLEATIGGSFASDAELEAIPGVAREIVCRAAATLNRSAQPTFTSSSFAGEALGAIRRSALSRHLVAHDPLERFEAAAAEMLTAALSTDGDASTLKLRLERLTEGLGRDDV